MRAPLAQDQATVNLLLQLVEPINYAKFCESTVVVVANVLSSANSARAGDSFFELGFSMNEDQSASARNTNQNEDDDARRQALLDMIDNGLNDCRSSSMYDEQSIDDARSMVESLQNQDDKSKEEDDIIKNVQALLAGLKNDQAEMDNAANEEAKQNDVNLKMSALGDMIAKADALRESQN